jgi:Arm DNA-binding domain
VEQSALAHRALKRATRTVLTVTKIESLRPRDRRFALTDAAMRGLQLRVEITGRKVWVHRYSWNGHEVRLTLGGYSPEFGLREARAEVIANQDLLKQGIDPRTVRVRKHKRGSPPAPLVAATALPVTTSSRPADTAKAPGMGSLLKIVPPTWPRDSHSLRLFAALTPLSADKRHSVEFLIYEFVLLFVVRARKDTATIARVLRVEALAHWKGRDARTITPREVVERLDTIQQMGARSQASAASLRAATSRRAGSRRTDF